MAQSPTWKEILDQNLCPDLPRKRLRYHPKAGNVALAGIDCGVLYLLASWLPVSVSGFGFLTEAMAAGDPDGLLAIEVVDARGAEGLWPAEASPLLWAKYPRFRKFPDFKSDPQGWARRVGGALWVRDGKVVDVTLGEAPENLMPSIQAALGPQRTTASLVSQRTVAAVIPNDSVYSLDVAVKRFNSLTYARTRLKAEKVKGGRKSASGFRVVYGDWCIAVWQNKEPLTAADHKAMLRAKPLPVSAEVIRSCRQSLTIWADPDPRGRYAKQWAHCLTQLQKAFGLLIWDYESDNWWVA